MFRGPVPFALFASMAIALTSVALCQPAPQDVDHVLSNREARKLALLVLEATVPPGFNPTEFTVQIKVADGDVTDVSNPHSLPDPLFAAAEDAARQWRFPDNRWKDKPHRFEAEITFHGPVAGRVITKDGSPVAGVVVSGSVWKCCPPEQDRMTTDSSGSFHIEHTGTVLHFQPPESFQPQALVIPPETPTLNLNLIVRAPVCPLQLAPSHDRDLNASVGGSMAYSSMCLSAM